MKIDHDRPATFSGRKASQMTREIQPLARLFEERCVTSYLEIGARHGDTFHYLVSRMPKGSRAVAVDLPGGAWGKESSVHSLQAAAADLRAKGYDITVILGDSTSIEVIRQVEALAPYEAALIDGDHRFEGVHADWLAYGGLAKVVAFHDIVGDGQRHGDNMVEVPRFWQEVKKGRHTMEFLAQGSKMGIGVILNAE